ncbi:N-acetylglucosamine-specific PTS transporter subunit IIBC [Agrococcus sp. SGAir0287]|uniref:N-acetylglucosamine-specific PTS transporter subunit IIBC n=1 Tax=Agrococcus sp. SGAir0287 TaxID=2070347 RepID=UPI0010CCCFC2|nr:N-acetylglucosamine-specific PTS transporter subunit IIBC [Agrococcus sp. SGAir0287]QCR20530.1 PTS sucrose transporter subunit IIBC [Agrococcus sp. SGAir0287]
MKFFQRLGKSLMLPVAVLPVAAILSGIGYWIQNTAGENVVQAFFTAAGGALLDNLPLLFAIGVAIGMASKPDGTAALAGLVSYLVVTRLLSPDTVAMFQGVAAEDVDLGFTRIQNAFVGILCGLIGALCYDRFKDVQLPAALSFFSGKRSVAIVTAGASLVVAVVLYFVWPVLFGGLVALGEWMVGLGPVGAGLYGFFNRLLIPLGLHHALNAVFWFDVAGINDLGNFLNDTGTYGVTGQYMTGFFPIMMFGLPGAALAMYLTAKTTRRKVTAGILLSGAFASFFVGVTEPLEFAFMFLAPWLYVVHAIFTGISLAVSAILPVRMGFGFSGGFIDLVLGWVNPLAQNPWMIFVMGAAWFGIYFAVFYVLIKRFDLKTPGREDEETEDLGGATGSTRFTAQAAAILAGLGGKDNVLELDNCATRLRMEIADVSKVDDVAIRRAGAAGVMKPGGRSVQVIYGLEVQFVKDAMEDLIAGRVAPPSPAEVEAVEASAAPTVGGVATATVITVRQPVEGRVVPLSQVPDATFAQGIMGPGLAIEPTGSVVVAPADGTVAHVFPTGHAVAMVLGDGTELLVHVGIDTVEMQGQGFTTLVEVGDAVTEGTPLIEFDPEAIRAAGHPTVTPVILLNGGDAELRLR